MAQVFITIQANPRATEDKMTNEELAEILEHEYYATCAGTPGFSEDCSLREFLHSRGFSKRWLTLHGYTDENYDNEQQKP